LVGGREMFKTFGCADMGTFTSKSESLGEAIVKAGQYAEKIVRWGPNGWVVVLNEKDEFVFGMKVKDGVQSIENRTP
jgi:hypothetical protein